MNGASSSSANPPPPPPPPPPSTSPAPPTPSHTPSMDNIQQEQPPPPPSSHTLPVGMNPLAMMGMSMVPPINMMSVMQQQQDPAINPLTMGMPGIINPNNFNQQQQQQQQQPNFNPQWNPALMQNPNPALNTPKTAQDMANMQRMQGVPDMNSQFANYAAMMAAMNPAAFGANPAAMNPFLFQQMLAANPMYAQMLAMMGGNPAAMGYDFNWFNNAFRNPVNPHMNMQATGFDPASGRPVNMLQTQQSAIPSQQKKTAHLASQGIQKKPPPQTQRAPVNMGSKMQPPVRGTSPGNKVAQTRKPAISSVSTSRDPKVEGAGKPDLFKKQLQAEKRRGLNPCSLHVALARSIAKARDVFTPDEVLPQPYSQPKSRESQGQVEHDTFTDSSHRNHDGGSFQPIEYAQRFSKSSQPEDLDSAGGTEETEEEGNIDDLAAAATLASAFASQSGIESLHVQQNAQQTSLSRSPSRKRTADELDISADNSSSKRHRGDEQLDQSVVETADVAQNDTAAKEQASETKLHQDLVGKSIRILSSNSNDWKEAVVRDYHEQSETYVLEYGDGVQDSVSLANCQVEVL